MPKKGRQTRKNKNSRLKARGRKSRKVPKLITQIDPLIVYMTETPKRVPKRRLRRAPTMDDILKIKKTGKSYHVPNEKKVWSRPPSPSLLLGKPKKKTRKRRFALPKLNRRTRKIKVKK